MREIRTQIDINAPRETVWNVLTEFSRYSEWNPFVTSISGDLEVGARLTVRIEPTGGKAMTFKPTVVQFLPHDLYSWLGHLVVPRLFDGHHIFELHAIDLENTRLVQREEFRGLLMPLFWKFMNGQTRDGFLAMNEALKSRSEASGNGQESS